MEKIQISYKRDLKIFLFAYAVVSAISILFFKVNLEVISILGLSLTLMFLMITVSNYVAFPFIYFSNRGLVFKTPLREREIQWEELSIEIKKQKKDQVKIVLNSFDFKKQITVDYIIIESLIDLTKKYCPKEHDLYVTIEEFSVRDSFSSNF